MVNELLKYVAENHLEDVFHFNDRKGIKPYEIEVISYPNGTYAVMVNGNGDYGEVETHYGISEAEMCKVCYKWLDFHLKLRNFEIVNGNVVNKTR